MTDKKHYPEVAANPNFPEIEENILKFWRENGTFENSVKNRDAKKDGADNEFIFYDGPPFANGLPHYGHLLTGFVKDIFARYQTIKGKKVERRFGWDCHGLPAEMGAEKELGISGRHKIVEHGIDNFNNTCRTSVMKFSGEWKKYVERQARWVDFENGYKTMDKNYMESVLWAFSELYKKGLVYESMRVMPYSWACETPLSNFETRMDNSYRERTDKAATVAFELEEVPDFIINAFPRAEKCKVLAWTTTPWTLPSNLALAVGEEVTYYPFIKGDEVFIASSSFVEKNEDNMHKDGYEFYRHIEDGQELNWPVEASSLAGLTYKPLFPYFAEKEGAFKIVAADFVTEGDGTGIVHLAPGFGEDDFEACKKENIAGLADPKVQPVCPVDNAGCYTDEIFDLGGELPLPVGEGWGEGKPSDQYNKDLKKYAVQLRKNQTDVEKTLWQLLRNRQILNCKFYRQRPIGKYIADFVCRELKLIIELDGGQHAEQAEYDSKRTEFLEGEDYTVLRFWNNEVVENLEGVMEVVYSALAERQQALPLTPSHREGGFPQLSLKGLNVIAQTTGKCDAEPYKEKQLQDNGLANLRIINYLKITGQLIKMEDYKHNYPHCWRTDTPLIYKAVPSWYVEVTKFKDRMVELNQQINWIPSHVKDGQFGKWLENARDWSISRNRFWGAPIPIWKSDNPNSKEPIKVFGSIAEIEEFFKQPVEDLHRPFIDEITTGDDPEQPDNPRYYYKRVEDVFDCWFESGSMPYAQAHYPFENKDWFEGHFPADFIVEYVAQTRGWFYTLMVLSTALFDRPPFLNVICHGVVLDDKGQKLSKRLQNYADPMDVFERFGSDAMRWVMISAPIMHGGELLIDKEGNMIRDAVRLVMKPIWNSYSFFALYANADGIEARFHPYSDNLMDRYILAKCKDAVFNIEKAMDAYDTPLACHTVEGFFEVLNNWYIRRNKDRFWRSEKDTDKYEAYNTLYSVLHIMCRAVSPLLPLLSEEIWRGLGNDESVHLQDFPDLSEVQDEAHLMRDMDRVRDACNAALSIRSAENLRVRQPLSSLTIVDIEVNRLEDYSDLIKDEVNVKEVKFSDDLEAFASRKLKVNFPVLGKRIPAKIKDVIAATKQGKWQQNGDGLIEAAGEVLTEEECSLQLEPKDSKGAQSLSSNDALVLLDLNVTEQLKIEGIARDMVRFIQQSRKDADLNITDRISLNVETANSDVKTALISFAEYIAEQTLAESVEEKSVANCNHRFEQKIEGGDVVIGFSKAQV